MLPKQKLMVVSYSKKKLPQKRFSKNGISNQLLKFMYLKQKIIAVNRILRSADDHVVKFQSQLNLTCAPHCSHCCKKADIETTALEFLPAAYNLLLSGKYNTVLDSIDKKSDGICIFYDPLSAERCCRYYKFRGLLCRLFGFSKKTEKTGNHSFVSCKSISQTNNIYDIQKRLRYAPEMSDYYLKLYGIDPNLTVQYFPINESIKKALEIVLLHFRRSEKQASNGAYIIT